MAEQWQRALKTLRELRMPPGVRDLMEAGPRGGDFPPRRGRFLAGVVALVICVAAGSLAWNAFRSSPSGPASHSAQDAPDVAEILCSANGTKVLTPIVEVQADGVHFQVDGEGEPTGLAVASEDGSQAGADFPRRARYPVSDVLVVPVGQARVQCGVGEGPVTNGVPIDFVDPSGLWHQDRIACDEAGSWTERGPYVFFTDGNPFPEAIGRAVPGVLATDEISYAGYPVGEWGGGRFRIVREGRVVAYLEVTNYDIRTFVGPIYSCNDDGVGEPGRATVGVLGSPFELPGLSHCDPYQTACSTVYLSAAQYAGLRGEESAAYAFPAEPWMACLESQPGGCEPDPNDVVLPILLRPGDAIAFVTNQGCGSTSAEACG